MGGSGVQNNACLSVVGMLTLDTSGNRLSPSPCSTRRFSSWIWCGRSRVLSSGTSSSKSSCPAQEATVKNTRNRSKRGREGPRGRRRTMAGITSEPMALRVKASLHTRVNVNYHYERLPSQTLALPMEQLSGRPSRTAILYIVLAGSGLLPLVNTR